MARDRTAYLCSECGAGAPRWLGRCPACGEWGTLVEEAINTTRAVPGLLPADAPRPVPIGDVDPMGADRSPTGLGELDRVLGGGLVPLGHAARRRARHG
jgi:DNA repair protein RadA/Sms